MGPVHIAQREEGQGLVEFALIVPILMVIILGMIDLGKALGYKNDQTNLANQAARLAVVSAGTNCQPCATASQTLENYIITTAPPELQNGSSSIATQPNLKGITVSFAWADGAAHHCTGDPITATVTSKYIFLGYLIGKSAIFGSHDISSSATMRMETNYDPTSLTNRFTPTPAATGTC